MMRSLRSRDHVWIPGSDPLRFSALEKRTPMKNPAE